MKKLLSIMMLFVGLMFVAWMGLPTGSSAEVNVNIGVRIPPPPPPLVIPAPPPVMVIPDTYVYYPPEVDVDIFFYGGFWYRPHQGHWYRSRIYNGRWAYLATDRVPRVLLNIDPNFRRLPPGHRRVEYSHFRKNWKQWEKEKYWDKHGYGYEREQRKEERHHGEEEHHGKGGDHH